MGIVSLIYISAKQIPFTVQLSADIEWGRMEKKSLLVSEKLNNFKMHCMFNKQKRKFMLFCHTLTSIELGAESVSRSFAVSKACLIISQRFCISYHASLIFFCFHFSATIKISLLYDAHSRAPTYLKSHLIVKPIGIDRNEMFAIIFKQSLKFHLNFHFEWFSLLVALPFLLL